MPDTHGFETVAEFSPAFLRRVLRAAWKSGGTESDPNVIPEFFDVPPGGSIGGWTIADGQVQIPQAGLDISLAPDVNGVEMKFDLDVQVEVEDPPVPSVRILDLPVEARVRAPVAPVGNGPDVAIQLTGLPLANVSAQLIAGDPLAALVPTATQELVHAMYQADGAAFPHTINRPDQPMQAYGQTAYTADVFVELFDDPAAPAPGEPDRRILVSNPTPTELRLSIPLRLRVSDIHKHFSLAPNLEDPMAITARLIVTAPYSATAGSIAAQLTLATVSVEDLQPVPGIEGDNFTTNDGRLAGQLDVIVAAQMEQEGEHMVQAMSDIAFTYPTVPQIEQRIREVFHETMVNRGTLSVWTPSAGSGQTQINDVAVKALASALALGVNAGAGADANALADFIPASREFAIGVSAAKVHAFIEEAIHRPESEGGFGNLPHHLHDVDGHDADLNILSHTLVSGAIRFSGEVTVIDALPPKIDVDADFEVDVGLHWEDNADGTQRMAADPGDPDVDAGLLGWILLAIAVLFTPAGLIGAVIVVVVALVVESTAERIGGQVARDSANQVTGLDALPEQLEHIGEVDASFENPIAIASDGLVFSG